MHENFEHTADIGIRVRTNSLPSLFEEAAIAMFSAITPNLTEVRPVKEITFRLAAEGIDYLLLDWLRELLFVFETQRLTFSQFQVRLSETPPMDAQLVKSLPGETQPAAAALEATAIGEAFDPDRHGEGNEVKAVTYHELTVRPEGDGWLAEFILDT
jgi:SHS2 domain-containing protein